MASKQYINLLTNVDMNVRTTTRDLLVALSQAGFPSEKITIIDEHKAGIELGGILCTITDAQLGHAFLYDNNNIRKYLDFIHTPADLVAAYLVERYCSENWLEEEAQRRLELYKECEKRRKEKLRLYNNYLSAIRAIGKALRDLRPYESLHDNFMKAGLKYYKFVDPETPDDVFLAKLETEWQNHVKRAKHEFEQEKRSAAARKRYETVTKPRMQAKKQEVIEQKQALLQEYKEKYGVECKFKYVHSPYDPHHRFVVPAIEGQVVSFFVPAKFERVFYDKAMELVAFLNELTKTYGKSKVQKKGSLPEEANKSLSKLLGKLDIGRQWQGIYNESQRHYLDATYEDEIVIKK
jgi:sugar-specific transcriptional regulator TrmB